MDRENRHAFTLIELSIVLVIIGLIVGGVLVGRDLVKSAQVRSQISQLAQFDAGISTFVTKFNALPGDITNPAAFGLYVDNSPTPYYIGGNGDGIIQDETGAYPITRSGKEPGYFWTHLSESALIPFKYVIDKPAPYSFVIDYQCPRAKLGNGGIHITSIANGNLYYFMGITNITPGGNPYLLTDESTGPILTPPDAFALDSKIDDGLPTTGSVIITTLPAVADTTSNSCLTSVVANTYNISRTSAACNLLVRKR